MEAIARDVYGSTDVVELRQVERPQPADDEVLVRVEAAGVDRAVWHLMAGLPYPIRLAGYGVRAPKNPIIGADFAGVVEEIGSNVTRFKPGDEVFGFAKGAYAEHAVALEKKLAHKPVNLSFEQSAVVAMSGLPALQALRDHAQVEEGQKVLIIGASGGVGSYAVQIAKAFGAEVTGVASTSKVDLVRSLGADHVIDYTKEDFAAGTERYDAIIDIGGNSPLSRLRRALSSRGTLVIVGGEGGGRWFGGLHRQLGAVILSPFVGQKLTTFVSSENSDDIIALKELVEAGKVTPAIDRSFALPDAAAAIRYLEEGRVRGKVVITI